MAAGLIRQAFEQVRARFEALAVLSPPPIESSKAAPSSADDQLGRLRIWAVNIGVAARGHASLDHRLRDGKEARQLTINLLETLYDHIDRAIEVSERSNFMNTTHGTWAILAESPTDMLGGSSSSVISSSFHGTETESLAEIIELAPFERHMRAIEQCIDRLYRLSLAIRRPSALGHNEIAAKGVMRDEDGNDNEPHFFEYALARLKHLFPSAPESLLKNLATAITSRRRRFQYRSRHQLKLANQGHEEPSAPIVKPKAEDRSEQVTIVGSKRESLATHRTARLTVPNRRPPGSQVSATSASAFNKSQFHHQHISELESVAPTTVRSAPAHRSTVAVPEPPPVKPGAKELECPYCCLMISIEETTPSKWRRHVMADLEPYVCLFDGCPDGAIPIRDVQSWIIHMQSKHTAQWSCSTRQCAPFVVDSEEKWEEHMRTVHAGTFAEGQLPLLKKKSRRPSPIIFSACPLCGYEPPSAALPRQSEILTLSDAAKLRSDSLVKHVATHLESSSQMALPWQDAYRKPAESDRLSSSQVERDSLKGEVVDTETLHFEDEDDDQERASTTIEWWRQTQECLDQVQASQLAEEDWKFLELEPTIYFGHDRDPTLQTFLQKLYLDTTPTAYHGRGPLLPTYMVPVTPVSHFFGRHYALDALSNALLPQKAAHGIEQENITLPRTFAVHAPGGMGKTQLSAQFVAEHRDKFDAVFWVHADERNKLASCFADIAIELELVEENSADARDLTFTRDVVKRWLVNPLRDLRDLDKPNPPLASWLLVYDGVEDPAVLNEFWPYNGPGSVLITSRSPFSWTASVQLAPFTEQEAIDFLLKLTGEAASDEQRKAVGKVNHQLGGLPLALAQMAGLMQHKKLTFAEFLESYKEQEELLRQSDSDLVLQASGYEHTLASVWAFENLAHGGPMLNLVSMLDPDGIIEGILTVALTKPGVVTPFPKSWPEYIDARNELVACSLLRRDKVEKKFAIHRLVQDVARARMTTDEFRQSFMSCVRLITELWPFDKFNWRHDVGKWADCEPLFSHVSRLKALWQQVAGADDYSNNDYLFARLLTDAGWYHHERGRSSDARVFNDLAQDICFSLKRRLRRPSGTDSPSTQHWQELDRILAEIEHNRGCIATEINEPSQALIYHTRFNNLMVQELGHTRGGKDMRLAISWNELGNAHMLNREWETGQECFERSIALMRQLDDFEEILVSLPMVNLGLAHWLQGRVSEALEVLQKGLLEREAKHGSDDRVSFITGRYYHALGNVKATQGDLVESQNYHHRALMHYKYTLGNNHHRTADTLVKVAEHHLRRGQDEMALQLLEAASKIYASSSGSSSGASAASASSPSGDAETEAAATATYKPERARAGFKRAQALRALDRGERADAALRECFGLYRDVFEADLLRQETLLTEERIDDERSDRPAAAAAAPPSTTTTPESRKRKGKQRPQDLTDEDLVELVAFWSK